MKYKINIVSVPTTTPCYRTNPENDLSFLKKKIYYNYLSNSISRWKIVWTFIYISAILTCRRQIVLLIENFKWFSTKSAHTIFAIRKVIIVIHINFINLPFNPSFSLVNNIWLSYHIIRLSLEQRNAIRRCLYKRTSFCYKVK